ncbi:(2Fe-2S) ferredoxin [Streptomyces chrestomyceticus JCM 4735]|uniref:(2Fe-2S) ferredoxin n=2 Tax=Streptomyces chrestomyceticus TaxID=68185 RepID=A0A7U9KPX5_9ACTN|nr:(2Fe-2S) ferredoxin [Streptomyces chrestomyceticus JCM 4735]
MTAVSQQPSLARILLAAPHTVILDEATSLLDPAAARHAEQALAAVFEGRTVISIAHRLHTAQDADRIAPVEHGQVVELGAHGELLAQDGIYAALWRSWQRAEAVPAQNVDPPRGRPPGRTWAAALCAPYRQNVLPEAAVSILAVPRRPNPLTIAAQPSKAHRLITADSRSRHRSAGAITPVHRCCDGSDTSAKTEEDTGMAAPPDLFSPARYDAVRRNREKAETLPAWCYTDDEWFQRETAKIFRPAWHFVDLDTSLPEPGTFLTTTLLGESVIVIRDREGGVRGFRNSCRHRGAELLGESQGSCRAIRCPYHSWTYDLDGTLLMAPGTETEYARSALGNLGLNLTPVPCASRHGMIYVNVSPKPPVPLDVYLGDYPERVAAPYQVSRMVCVRRLSYDLATNWKLYCEVEMETLHTKHIHRRSIGEQPVTAATTQGEWIAVVNTDQPTPALYPGSRSKGFPRTPGIYGPAEEGTYFSTVLPGSFIVTAPDCMWWIRKIPTAPGRLHTEVGYCFPRETVARPDFAELAEAYNARWDQVMDEDNQIVEVQYRGLRSSVPGCYTAEEPVVHRFDNWVLDRVLDEESP